MILTAQQVLQNLAQRQYAPVYFLYGEETYYIDQIADYIADSVLLDSEKPFNLIVAYGKDQEMAQILSYAKRYPVAAEKQVVILKEAQDLPGLHSEIGQKLFFNYLRAPNPATLLVFSYKYKNLDARTILHKRLAEDAILVHAKKLYDNQIPEWISDYVAKKGLKIVPKACFMLQERVGNNLPRLAKELDKIQINLQEGALIEDHIIQAYVGISKEFNAFELQKALATRNIYQANQIVFAWAANAKNNPVIPVVALLFTFFTRLLLIHKAKDKSKHALSKLLAVNPYFIQDYLTAARNYSLPQIVANIEHLHQADLQLKGVDYPAIPEGQILKELVFKLLYS